MNVLPVTTCFTCKAQNTGWSKFICAGMLRGITLRSFECSKWHEAVFTFHPCHLFLALSILVIGDSVALKC